MSANAASTGRPHLHVAGVAFPDGTLSLKPVRLRARERATNGLRGARLVAEVMSGDRLLLRWGIPLGGSAPEIQQGLPARFVADVPFPEEATSLVLRLDGVVANEIARRRDPPAFASKPRIERTSGGFRVEAAVKGVEPVHCFLRGRRTIDQAWLLIAGPLVKSAIELPEVAFAGMDAVELVASNGFVESVARLDLPERIPSRLAAVVVAPPRTPPGKIELEAHPMLDGRSVDARCEWFVNGAPIGRGPRVTWTAHEPGEARVRLRLAHGGLEHDVERSIEVVPLPAP